MHLKQWQSWHGILNHITSPHVWRVERVTPWVSTSSPNRGVSFRLLALIVVLACLNWTAPRHVSAATPDDGAASAHEVIKWNQLLRQIVLIPGAQPPTIPSTRSLAMLHIALFDAVNAIEQSFTPYFIEVWASRGASKQAAAAQAAHDVLVALYP
jgi:hypothetical protein